MWSDDYGYECDNCGSSSDESGTCENCGGSFELESSDDVAEGEAEGTD